MPVSSFFTWKHRPILVRPGRSCCFRILPNPLISLGGDAAAGLAASRYIRHAGESGVAGMGVTEAVKPLPKEKTNGICSVGVEVGARLSPVFASSPQAKVRLLHAVAPLADAAISPGMPSAGVVPQGGKDGSAFPSMSYNKLSCSKSSLWGGVVAAAWERTAQPLETLIRSEMRAGLMDPPSSLSV